MSNTVRECDGEGVNEQHRECEGVREHHRDSVTVRV